MILTEVFTFVSPVTHKIIFAHHIHVQTFIVKRGRLECFPNRSEVRILIFCLDFFFFIGKEEG